MEGLQSCSDISDAKPFYPKRHLYLKPLLKINISIQLPSLKLVGKSISNVTLMENIRTWAAPDKFCSVKVTKSTLEFIRFEADLLNPAKVHAVLARLDGKQVTLAGFKETVKVRASVAKSDFPTRHDWDTFFRDAKQMNEMKAGERPDTLHISDLPNKWFSTKNNEDLPSESLLKKIFQQFGEVTSLDIPCVDPYRSKMKAHLSGMKLFNFNQNTTFEAYVQYKDYISFVKAMDYLRGMKLLKIEADEAFTTTIKVDFDKTKHLSETSIRKRKIEREKLMEKDRELEEKKQKLEDALKKLEEKGKEMENNEGKRKNKENCPEDNIETAKILKEEKLLLAAQRKLESIRLLTELFRIIKEHKEKGITEISPSKIETQSKKVCKKDSLISSSETKKEDASRNKKVNSIEDGSRLNSEVVKVIHSSIGDRSRNTENQELYHNNGRDGSFKPGRWSRQRWSSMNEGIGRRMNSPKRPYIQHNSEYFRDTHQLYYKYFQSLTKKRVRSPNESQCSLSRSNSRTDENTNFDIKRSTITRSRSRSRSWTRSRSSSRIDINPLGGVRRDRMRKRK